MALITIRAGQAYMVTSPEREAALGELRDSLATDGVAVNLEIIPYEPGYRGLPAPPFPEEVAVYIANAVGSGLIDTIVAIAYSKAKQWAKSCYERKRNAAESANKNPDHVKGERFIIYGPDGKILKTWTIDKNGEHETDDG
ncbi:hypothetical protein [Ferrimicrobium sp.]|uniref:hypothetical protein n=1 Tax=Ferrimicrobium sp. TaxID=2926050 RepID=UPI002628DE6B|nr:hypothetical protein [Ferrimicrobium sp.]